MAAQTPCPARRVDLRRRGRLPASKAGAELLFDAIVAAYERDSAISLQWRRDSSVAELISQLLNSTFAMAQASRTPTSPFFSRRSGRGVFGFVLVGRTIAQRLVQASAIVERIDVEKNAQPRLFSMKPRNTQIDSDAVRTQCGRFAPLSSALPVLSAHSG